MTSLPLLHGIVWYCMVLSGIMWPSSHHRYHCDKTFAPLIPLWRHQPKFVFPTQIFPTEDLFNIWSFNGLELCLCENRQKLFDQDWKAGMCRGGVAGNGLWVEGSNLAVNFLPLRWLPPYLTASLHISNQPASDSKGAKLAGITDLPAGDTNILVRKKTPGESLWLLYFSPRAWSSCDLYNVTVWMELSLSSSACSRSGQWFCNGLKC